MLALAPKRDSGSAAAKPLHSASIAMDSRYNVNALQTARLLKKVIEAAIAADFKQL